MFGFNFKKNLRRNLALFWALSLGISAFSFAADEAALRALQQGGHVLVMRHAQTVPGIGDPPNFKIGDCSTQRNLSDVGRESAKALGGQLQKANVKFDLVETSAWCRCVDTAKLVFTTRATIYAPINSTFNDRSVQPNRTDEVQKRIRNWRGAGNLALVSHNVNIQSLTDRKSTRLNSSHVSQSRMPSSA